MAPPSAAPAARSMMSPNDSARSERSLHTMPMPLRFASAPETPPAATRTAPSHRPKRHLPLSLFSVLLGATALSVSCSGDENNENEDAFVVRSTGQAIASGGSELIGDGDWLAYRVSEAGQGAAGTDFNGDGDTSDGVAVRVNTSSGALTNLGVAALDLAFARRTMFLLVDEAQDSEDWNGDLDMTDTVILYATPSASTPTFLEEALPGSAMVTIGGTLIFASATAPTMAMESNLRVAVVATTNAAPGPPAMALTGADPNNDGITFSISGSEGDIVFLDADEAVDGDLNGDGDMVDADIFGVLDAGEVTPQAFNVGLGFQFGSTPTAVPVSGGGEWLVAFLVDETKEGVSLNDPGDFSPSWVAPNCMDADVDTNDAVLHWFQVTDLAMSTPAVNTGLIGKADGTAYALRSGFVGVVSPEDEQGSGTCIYNGDGDENDDVFRWVAASNPAAPPLPVITTSQLIAIDDSIPGGTNGVVRLQDTWVIQADEAADGRDYDTQPGTNRNVILAHNPSSSAQPWNALHGASTSRPVGATWMAQDPDSASRFYAAFSEEHQTITGTGDINLDGDVADSVPTLPQLVNSNRLQFPGVTVATSRNNSGLIVEQDVAYHRVSEADQGATDLNGDGDTNDVVLQRFSLSNMFGRTFMATSNSVNRPAVDFGAGSAEFGAFLTEEFLDGIDLNGDGDASDFVVRYFELP